jgi:hypothetical protein
MKKEVIKVLAQMACVVKCKNCKGFTLVDQFDHGKIIKCWTCETELLVTIPEEYLINPLTGKSIFNVDE